MPMLHDDEPDYKRVFTAMLLAGLLLIGWQALVEWPKRQALAKYNAQHEAQIVANSQVEIKSETQKDAADENPNLTPAQRLALSPRVTFDSDTLHGSIALKGARFDDLTLSKYKESLDKSSPNVTLLSPSGDEQAYFAQAGWLAASDGKLRVPDQNSLWQTDAKTLSPGHDVHLRWDNGEGVVFVMNVSLDNAYMFNITQTVENHSGHAVSVLPYGYVNRQYLVPKQQSAIMHEGPIGVLDGSLDEINYKDLIDRGNKVFENASGWFGITDKYWQASFIPSVSGFKATFSHYMKNGKDRYQADYLGQPIAVEDGASQSTGIRLFAGAKELKVLDHYTQGDSAFPPVPLFDRSVDFGWLYFLTKPMLHILSAFYAFTGNFGIAILMLTILVKMALFPLANKSFKATSRMRDLQPQMNKIREKYFDDKIKLNQEIMALYKREKVNPASGCLPLFIQMPVFFSLYKVLYVSIEMRQAPFFGWIKDLSMPDPSNLFTGFGLVQWDTPVWLHLGILPMLYCATMVVQMRQQPKPADPVQANMMKYMPFFLLYVFAKFPAGLVVYWTWSNLLSIIQQQIITRRHKLGLDKKAAQAA